jgi:hypothetical protein
MKRDAKKLIFAITVMFILGYTAREVFPEPESETVEVTAIGVGKTVEDAQNNAIINAVQQVVGLYVDAETFVKNEQLVVDQVLSVSSGFVSSFEVKLPPRKRLTDGLFETTIKAVVQKTRVADQLSKSKIVSVSVNGQDAWAEAFSRLQNAQDGKRLLEKYWPEVPLKLLRASLVDDNGRSITDASRPAVKPDANSGLVWCAWNIEVSYDTDAYFKDVAPRLKRIFDAICLRKTVERINRKTPTILQVRTSDGRVMNYGGRRIAIAGTPIRWVRLDSFSPLPERKEQSEFNLALIATTDRAGFFQAAESYVLEASPYARTLWNPSVGNTLVLRLIKKDGSILQDDKMPLDRTYLECVQSSGQRSSQYNIPIAGVPAEVFRTSLLSGINGGCSGDLRSFCTINKLDGTSLGQGYGMWLIAPEFSFDGNIYTDNGPWGPTWASAVTDRLILRYETQLHPDDLKELKEVQLSFAHQPPQR